MLIKLTIDRYENDKAVLLTNDGEKIIWPKKKLPENIKEGSKMLFIIADNKKEEEFSKKLAKDILNEILDTKEAEGEK